MYLPIPQQPDCAAAWREALRVVDGQPAHEAYNVIIDVADPVANTTCQDPRIAAVDDFLTGCGKSVETVANTIFPDALYRLHRAPAFFEVFTKKVLPKVRKAERWSGYYFERMINYPGPGGQPVNQLADIIERIRNGRALNRFELSLYDPIRDVDDSPYGGQCLSFLSFKLLRGDSKTLMLTALYRNHYYVTKLLGNLIGLGRLMSFIARECNVNVGGLTIVSTHAEVDTPNKTRRSDIEAMLTRFEQADALLRAGGR
jgi:hypothetical protein